MKVALANQRVILGYKRTDVKRVTFDESDIDNTETAVRAVYQQEGKTLEQRLKKTEEDVLETKAAVNKILKMLSEGNFYRRSRSPVRQNSPVRSNQCFNCGSEDHFVRDCPKNKGSSPNRLRQQSPQPRQGFEREPLNMKGSRI